MTEANKSWVGLAKQAAKGTPNVTDVDFAYLRFQRGAAAPQSLFLPTEPEVGGAALLGDVIKAGVTSQGAWEFIPRSKTIGRFLLGVLGLDTPAADGLLGYKHVMTMNTDEFATPYWTVRSSPGRLLGEQMQDCRIAALGFNFKGANFVRASAAFVGGLPAVVATDTWAAEPDNGPLFISPISSVTWPDGITPKVLSGAVSFGNMIPMDEQWIVGSYSPDGFDIVGRQIAIQLVMKIDDATLYKKMQYDAAGGAAWAASILKEADVEVSFVSTSTYDTAKPHKIVVKANGSETNPNVAWSCQPIGLEAGKQVKLVATGQFLQSTDGEDVTVELYNDIATY